MYVESFSLFRPQEKGERLAASDVARRAFAFVASGFRARRKYRATRSFDLDFQVKLIELDPERVFIP